MVLLRAPAVSPVATRHCPRRVVPQAGAVVVPAAALSSALSAPRPWSLRLPAPSVSRDAGPGPRAVRQLAAWAAPSMRPCRSRCAPPPNDSPAIIII
eukprot:4131775-Pleurochrysis_carterae.AAC.1